MKKRILCALLVTVLTLLLCVTVSADTPLILISGDPDCYPLEYYNADKKAYEGYLPALLSVFGERYGYRIEYLSPARDTRESDLQNAQADLISAAYAFDFTAEQFADGVTAYQGKEAVKLLFTEAASDSLRRDLTAFLQTLSAGEQSELFLSSVKNGSRGLPLYVYILAGGAFLLLVAGLVWTLVLLRRRRPPKETARTTDALTGLYNRFYLSEYYRTAVSDGDRALYSAVYIGGRFKNSRGDENALLRAMADALRPEVKEGDVLARVDDGFAVLMCRYGVNDAAAFAEAVTEKLNASLCTMGQFASASIFAGVYAIGARDRDIDRIIANAEYCSRFARSKGEAFSVYSPEIEQAEKEEEQLSLDLRSAFDNDEFTVHMQFFVKNDASSIFGAEMLSRWNHPTLGLLSPSRYIDLIEKESLFDRLDFLMLEKACTMLEGLSKKGIFSFYIACNFSRSTMVMPDFIERVERTVGGYSFPRNKLLFEVTEYARVLDTDALARSIQAVKSLGIKILIDDFGCGFSDLADIGRVQFDGVKMDRSLISVAGTKADDLILESLFSLMHKLGMTVIAEGIETAEQAERLRRLGCGVFQGYHFYLPMPWREALRILTNGK